MSKASDFIKEIVPLVVAEYTNRERWILPSVCIAQAALESGWDTECKTLFGIKGEGASYKTREWVNGEYVEVSDTFIEHPSLAEAVHYYYDFITSTSRYEDCINNSSYSSTTYHLIHTRDGAPYATAPDYDKILNSIIEDFNLTQYDFLKVADNDLRVGDKVKVITPLIYGTNQPFKLWFDTYEVIEVSGNRVVIGVDGVVTAPIHKSNLKGV